jgi:hypothetical protein
MKRKEKFQINKFQIPNPFNFGIWNLTLWNFGFKKFTLTKLE